MTEAQGGGSKDVAGHAVGAGHGRGEGAADLQERLVAAEIFLALVAGQFQRNRGHRQAHGFGQTAGIILDQFSGAGRGDDQRFGLEAVIGILAGGFEQTCRIGAQIARLKGGVS